MTTKMLERLFGDTVEPDGTPPSMVNFFIYRSDKRNIMTVLIYLLGEISCSDHFVRFIWRIKKLFPATSLPYRTHCYLHRLP